MEPKAGSRERSNRPSADNPTSELIPINKKIIPPSLADKVRLSGFNPDKGKAAKTDPLPAAEPKKGLIFPPTIAQKEAEQGEQSGINLVPVNRKVVKPSKIKGLSRGKGEPSLPAAPVLETPQEASPPPAQLNPINRKVIKPRTSDVFIHSEPRKDVVPVLKSAAEPQDKNSSTAPKGSQPVQGHAPRKIQSEEPKAAPRKPQPAPMEGKWPSQNLNSDPKEKVRADNELQMVPVEGGRPYQDNKIESKEAVPKQRDIGTPQNLAPHPQQDLSMVPIEGGIKERPLAMSPVEGGRRSPEAAMVEEKPRALKKSPSMLKESISRPKPDPNSIKQVKPERAFGNFIEDLKSEAIRQEYSLTVNPRGKMKVEFASSSKALIVAFEKQSLPFDRIIVKQIVPPHLERREQRVEIEISDGFVPKLKKLFGGNKTEKKPKERRGPQNKRLIGHLCDKKHRVVDWEFGSLTQDHDTPPAEEQVAVAAQYSVQGERNFWTVQLVNDGVALPDPAPLSETDRNLSETRIKRSLLVLLDGLADAIRADLVKAI